MTNKLANRQINNSYERLRKMKPRVQDEIRSKSGKITSKILVLHIYCTRKWLKESKCARTIRGKAIKPYGSNRVGKTTCIVGVLDIY
jgi:hypothetical protein